MKHPAIGGRMTNFGRPRPRSSAAMRMAGFIFLLTSFPPKYGTINSLGRRLARGYCRISIAWDLRTARKPIVIAAEFETEFFVVNPEIPVAAARHGVRHHRLHLLSDHTNIGLVVAEIAEPIITETVLEIAEQNNIVH